MTPAAWQLLKSALFARERATFDAGERIGYERTLRLMGDIETRLKQNRLSDLRPVSEEERA